MADPVRSPFELDRYDPDAIAQRFRPQPWRVLRRCLAIFVPLFFLFLRLWWDKRTGLRDCKAAQRAVEVRQLLTQLGPAFIKIGQALSTRPDIVPPVYMNELAQLQDQLPAFPNERAFQLVRAELGASPAELFAEISAAPIAAASLGQVYRGRLRSGEQVAIKVQRPDIAEGIALDTFIMRGLAAWAMRQFAFIRSNLVAILDEFATRIFEEMDYTLEGANAERFAELYGDLEAIYVPKIYWEYTAKRVLTMEWIEGIKLTELRKIADMGFDSRQIVEVGVQCSLRQLLESGFFHADPHPGNLLVTPGGKLAYLDFGMMSQVELEQRFGLIGAIVHLVNRDFDALARDYVRLGFLDETADLEAITPALARVFNEALGSSVAELNFKNITDQLSQIMYDYPFRVPAYYATIIRSLVTLEGIALSVDPNFKVIGVAYPYVAKRLLTDSSPELRLALQDVLLPDGKLRWNRLENLIRNAQADNSGRDLASTLDWAADFLLSERGEYLRDRLAAELVDGLAAETMRRWGRPSPQGETDAQDASLGATLEHLRGIAALLQRDREIQPLQLLPVAGRILLKSETQAFGRQLVWQLAQRLVARGLREIALRDGQGGVTIPPEAELETAAGSPFRRPVNGRTW